jgi:hypothetical protein
MGFLTESLMEINLLTSNAGIFGSISQCLSFDIAVVVAGISKITIQKQNFALIES